MSFAAPQKAANAAAKKKPSADAAASAPVAGQTAVAVGPPALSAKAWLLMDFDSGEVLASANADEPLPPASLTKMMTSFLVEQALRSGKLKKAGQAGRVALPCTPEHGTRRTAVRRSMFQRAILVAGPLLAVGAPMATSAFEPLDLRTQSPRAPKPPWPVGDERGMANVLGEATTRRCGWHMSQRGARTYEASFERSNTMPKSPFAPPSLSKPKQTAGVPFSAHAFNSEAFDAGAEPQQQGTQIDALGHFASIQSPWDPKNPFSADDASYYGGYKQRDVKPTPDSPLLKLGIEKIPPLVTTAVLLDAKTHVGKGKAMGHGKLVTAADIEAMLKAQGLAQRGILPGDMVWIYTGWSENWKDPADPNSPYYAMAPGLSVDAAKMLSGKRIVAIGFDAPFIDAVPEGMLQGKAQPAPGTDPGLPFSIHHYMLSVYGIHHLENLNLAAMTGDRVWTSCAMVLPSRDRGAAGAVIRPVAIGVPNQR